MKQDGECNNFLIVKDLTHFKFNFSLPFKKQINIPALKDVSRVFIISTINIENIEKIKQNIILKLPYQE